MWEGSFENSWIKKSDLSCDELIEQFHCAASSGQEPQVSNQEPLVTNQEPLVTNQEPQVSNQVSINVEIVKVCKPQKKSKREKPFYLSRMTC